MRVRVGQWEVTSTVIIQGIEGLRAVEETEKICFGCAGDGCRCGPCEEEHEDEMGCGGGNPWSAEGEESCNSETAHTSSEVDIDFSVFWFLRLFLVIGDVI